MASKTYFQQLMAGIKDAGIKLPKGKRWSLALAEDVVTAMIRLGNRKVTELRKMAKGGFGLKVGSRATKPQLIVAIIEAAIITGDIHNDGFGIRRKPTIRPNTQAA